MNALKEFADHVAGKRVLCAHITLGDEYHKNRSVFALKKGFRADEFVAFLNQIDFEYDAGYGGQELFGYIWYDDGSWSERGEYDGREWWEHKTCPTIPEELL